MGFLLSAYSKPGKKSSIFSLMVQSGWGGCWYYFGVNKTRSAILDGILQLGDSKLMGDVEVAEENEAAEWVRGVVVGECAADFVATLKVGAG